MRRILPALAVTAAALACRGKDAASDSAASRSASGPAPCVEGGTTPTLSAIGVGPVRVGARLESISGRCTVRDTSIALGDGLRLKARVVNLGAASLAVLVTSDSAQTIQRVLVADSSIRTEDGIGVGKTAGALRAAYGRLCATSDEGRIGVGVPPLPGVTFTLSAAPRPGVNVEATPEAIPDSSRVTQILVTGGRSACGGS